MEQDQQTYIKHVAGLASLLEWLYLHKKMGYRFDQQEHSVTLDLQFASKFLVGVPKSKKWGKYPFLAAQKREALFLQLLSIEHICISPKIPKIHFICSGFDGFGEQFPSIPPFYLTLTLDTSEKTDTLLMANQLDLRGYWFDEGKIEIATNDVVWTRPLVRIDTELALQRNLAQNPLTVGQNIKSLFAMKIPNH